MDDVSNKKLAKINCICTVFSHLKISVKTSEISRSKKGQKILSENILFEIYLSAIFTVTVYRFHAAMQAILLTGKK